MWFCRRIRGTNGNYRRKFRPLSVAFAIMVTFGVCGAKTQADDRPVALRLTLDRPMDGAAAPFAVAIARGLYRAENLNVTTDSVSASADSLARVASGATDAALADLNAFIRFRDRPDAVPMKAVFILHDAVGYAIMARKSRGIAALGDLAGKTLGVAENDIAIRLWPALAKSNRIEPQSVKQERIGAAVREPMLSAGQVDAVTGYSFLSAVNLRDRGIPADDLNVLRFAAHGSTAYGLALIVNTAFAASQPDAVRGLVRAITKAVQASVRDPNAAIADLMTQTNGLSRSLETERLAVVLHDCIATPAARQNGIGMAEPQRLDQSLSEIAEDFKFRQKPLPSDIFDSSFLPPAAARRIDEAASR